MSWKQRIHEELVEIVGQWRDIWHMGIVWLARDLCLNVRAQHRHNLAFFERLLQPADPRRFATKPPANWYGAPEKEAPESGDLFQKKDKGGIPNVFDGQLKWEGMDAHTVAQQRAAKALETDDGSGVVITPAEHGEMLAYRVSKTQTGLHNVALAKLIKPLWEKDLKPAEIAALLNYDRSTVAQYCTCLERARANGGKGKGNAFEVEVPNF